MNKVFHESFVILLHRHFDCSSLGEIFHSAAKGAAVDDGKKMRAQDAAKRKVQHRRMYEIFSMCLMTLMMTARKESERGTGKKSIT